MATAAAAVVPGKRTDNGILWKVHAALVLVMLGYGSSFILGKIALTTGVNAIVFAVYRDAVCLTVLLPIAYFAEKGKRTPLTVEIVSLFVAFGFFGAFLTQMLALFGLKLTSAAYASTISVLTPLFTFLISTSCGFEQIRWKRFDGMAKVGGLIVAFFGAVVLAVYRGPAVIGNLDSGGQTVPLSDMDATFTYQLQHFSIDPWYVGVLCLFIGGFTLSLAISIQVPTLARYPAPISITAFGYFFGALMLLITALLTVKDWSDLVITETVAVISYVYNGLIPAAFNFTMLIWSVQKAGPVLVGTYTPLQLFFAAALAYVVLGESIHLGSVLGTILIIIGLGFITWGQVKGQPDSNLPTKASPITVGITAQLEEPLLG